VVSDICESADLRVTQYGALEQLAILFTSIVLLSRWPCRLSVLERPLQRRQVNYGFANQERGSEGNWASEQFVAKACLNDRWGENMWKAKATIILLTT
jgi:hypothetical protein